MDDAELSDAERSYLAVSRGWDTTERGYSAIQSTKPQTPSAMDSTTPRQGSRHTWVRSGTRGATLRRPTTSSAPRSPCTGSRRASPRRCATIGTIAGTRLIPPTSVRPRRLVFSRTRPFPRGELPRSYLERLYNIQRWTVFPRGGHFAPAEEPAAVAGDLTAFFVA